MVLLFIYNACENTTLVSFIYVHMIMIMINISISFSKTDYFLYFLNNEMASVNNNYYHCIIIAF